MIKTITAILLLVSSAASIYYSFGGIINPETALVYNKANMSRMGIQLLSLFLGMGGMLLLFPTTFRVGGIFLITHSLSTIVCFVIIKDWKGGFFEFAFLQIPILIVCAGYPTWVLEKFKTFFTH